MHHHHHFDTDEQHIAANVYLADHRDHDAPADDHDHDVHHHHIGGTSTVLVHQHEGDDHVHDIHIDNARHYFGPADHSHDVDLYRDSPTTNPLRNVVAEHVHDWKPYEFRLDDVGFDFAVQSGRYCACGVYRFDGDTYEFVIDDNTTDYQDTASSA